MGENMNFLKRLFKKSSKKVTLNSIELKEWLENESESLLADTNKSFEKYIKQANANVSVIKKKLIILQNAELLNDKITNREKHIMEGNRTNYIKKAFQFLENFTIPNNEYESIEIFANSFEETLQEFNSATEKNYFVLKNFYDSEMREIAQELRKLEENHKHIWENIRKDTIRKYKSLFIKIRELNEHSLEEEKIQKEIKELEESLESSINRLSSYAEKIRKLKEGNEYREFVKFDNAKEKHEKELKEIKDALVLDLVSIEKILKKYAHEKKDKLIKGYLQNPYESFLDDRTLKILNGLQKVKAFVEDSNLDIKENQKKKIIKALNKLDEKYFKTIHKKIININSEKAIAMESLKKSTAMMDYKELEYQSEHLKERIEKLKDDIDTKKTFISHLGIAKKAKKLEEGISEFTGHRVSIILDSIE